LKTQILLETRLQFMVRGISMRWKQPVGHFFTGTSVNADVLKSIGLRVAAIVCDEEICHRICLQGLEATAARPKFTTENGNDVYTMYDPPHLIKNLRNNMLRYDILIGNDVVSFDITFPHYLIMNRLAFCVLCLN